MWEKEALEQAKSPAKQPTSLKDGGTTATSEGITGSNSKAHTDHCSGIIAGSPDELRYELQSGCLQRGSWSKILEQAARKAQNPLWKSLSSECK